MTEQINLMEAANLFNELLSEYEEIMAEHTAFSVTCQECGISEQEGHGLLMMLATHVREVDPKTGPTPWRPIAEDHPR